ncbi:MAG: hypothetical protein JRI25_27145 [Deltaproteobacteria bacterium]|nr:hypothetical protein [Deltaproteobacteria bacterium]
MDIGADGVPEARSTLSYAHDARGRILTKEVDVEADGETEQRIFWAYDESGRRVSREIDVDADGTVDGRCQMNPPCAEPFTSCNCVWVR